MHDAEELPRAMASSAVVEQFQTKVQETVAWLLSQAGISHTSLPTGHDRTGLLGDTSMFGIFCLLCRCRETVWQSIATGGVLFPLLHSQISFMSVFSFRGMVIFGPIRIRSGPRTQVSGFTWP